MEIDPTGKFSSVRHLCDVVTLLSLASTPPEVVAKTAQRGYRYPLTVADVERIRTDTKGFMNKWAGHIERCTEFLHRARQFTTVDGEGKVVPASTEAIIESANMRYEWSTPAYAEVRAMYEPIVKESISIAAGERAEVEAKRAEWPEKVVACLVDMGHAALTDPARSTIEAGLRHHGLWRDDLAVGELMKLIEKARTIWWSSAHAKRDARIIEDLITRIIVTTDCFNTSEMARAAAAAGAKVGPAFVRHVIDKMVERMQRPLPEATPTAEPIIPECAADAVEAAVQKCQMPEELAWEVVNILKERATTLALETPGEIMQTLRDKHSRDRDWGKKRFHPADIILLKNAVVARFEASPRGRAVEAAIRERIITGLQRPEADNLDSLFKEHVNIPAALGPPDRMSVSTKYVARVRRRLFPKG